MNNNPEKLAIAVDPVAAKFLEEQQKKLEKKTSPAGNRYCPECEEQEMVKERYERMNLDHCPKCDGHWFDSNELDYFIDNENPEYKRKDLVIRSLGEFRGNGDLKCPVCDKIMGEYEITKNVELIVSVCHGCSGIWVNRGKKDDVASLARVYATNKSMERASGKIDWLFEFLTDLPAEKNVKPKQIPFTVIGLILLNCFVYIFQFIDQSGLLIDRFASYRNSAIDLQWFTALFTSQFLHAGHWHLIANMYFLYILGDNIEDIFGHWKFLLFYLSCGVVAGIADYFIMSPTAIIKVPVIGASGGVSGILAAYMFFYRNAKLSMLIFYKQFYIRAYYFALIWLLLNFLGFMLNGSSIAFFAHIGGFLCGLIVSVIFAKAVEKKSPFLKYV